MAGRRFSVAWHDDAEGLGWRYRTEKDVHLGRRWQALWRLRQGHRLREVAHWVGVHYRTVQEWVSWYRRGGVEEVARHRVGGPRRGGAARLTEVQEEVLLKRARQAGFATVGAARAWAAQELGVALTERQMRQVFEELGLKRKVPRPISTKASAQSQEAWKKGGLLPVWRRPG